MLFRSRWKYMISGMFLFNLYLLMTFFLNSPRLRNIYDSHWPTVALDMLTSRPTDQIPAYVITLEGHDMRVPHVKNLFQKHANLQLQTYYGINGNLKYETLTKFDGSDNYTLTPGEQGLRETMKSFFLMAHSRNYEKVFLFEDDAIPHYNFSRLFAHLNDRCRRADVLLLGASIRVPSRKYWPKHACFDATKKTYGAFSLFVQRSAFIPIVKWIESGPWRPFDHIYTHLQKQKLIVRVAFPPYLCIPDVTHPSLINNARGKLQFNPQVRATIHRWNLAEYPVISIPADNTSSDDITAALSYF